MLSTEQTKLLPSLQQSIPWLTKTMVLTVVTQSQSYLSQEEKMEHFNKLFWNDQIQHVLDYSELEDIVLLMLHIPKTKLPDYIQEPKQNLIVPDNVSDTNSEIASDARYTVPDCMETTFGRNEFYKVRVLSHGERVLRVPPETDGFYAMFVKDNGDTLIFRKACVCPTKKYSDETNTNGVSPSCSNCRWSSNLIPQYKNAIACVYDPPNTSSKDFPFPIVRDNWKCRFHEFKKE